MKAELYTAYVHNAWTAMEAPSSGCLRSSTQVWDMLPLLHGCLGYHPKKLFEIDRSIGEFWCIQNKKLRKLLQK